MSIQMPTRHAVASPLISIVLGVFVACTLLGNMPASASIIAYWQFEPSDFNGTSTITDDSGNGNTLNNNGVTSATGAGNVPTGPKIVATSGSASFDGSSYAVTASNLNLSSFTAGLTIEWFMKRSNTATGMIFEDSANYNSNTSGTFYTFLSTPTTLEISHRSVGAGNRDQITFTIPNDAAWHHYAVEYGNSVGSNGDPTVVIKLFVDGTPITGTAAPGNEGTNASNFGFTDFPLYIGERGGSSLAYTGLLDEMRISSGLLAPSEFLDAVPEPASLSLVSAAGVAMLARRRRVG